MSDEADRARRLLESCQMPGYDPEGAETYPAVEDGGVNSIGNALAAAQVLATLAVADELRRANEDRALFNATMREFFERLTEPQPGSDGSPVGSGQPAAAPGCRVCGNEETPDGEVCLFNTLSGVHWRTHWQHLFELALSYHDENGATRYANSRMHEDFGPCPEES